LSSYYIGENHNMIMNKANEKRKGCCVVEINLSLEIMYHRFSHRNIKKHTSQLCKEYGMTRKEYEEYVKEGMRQEVEMLTKIHH
jgi:hypothetical protein